MHIGRLCALLAEFQVQSGGYFIIENPLGSKLFEQSWMKRLWSSNRVYAVHFPQCALGLVSPEGDPILKRTTFWTNSLEVVYQFRNLRCIHSPEEHAELAGSYGGVNRTK